MSAFFQRGAMDGLMAVTPYNDVYLQAARPDLFITPSQQKGASIDLDGRFGLHPAMKVFEPLFREKRLAIVHGMGSPNKTRSHFDAQDYMETGTPGLKSTGDGWLNRYLQLQKDKNESPLQRHISETKSITLPYTSSVFSFEFASLNYTSSEKKRYAYKMEGFDNDWNYIGTSHTATYTNLDGGSYIFKVKGLNNQGEWSSKIATILITITPPSG